MTEVIKMKKIVFIEPSINNIYLNQVKSLSRYKDLEIYYISNNASKARLKGIIFIEPKCINILTRIIHFPTWALLRFISKKHKKYYLEFPESHYYMHLSKILREIKPDIIVSNLYYRPYSWQAGYFAKRSKIPFILQTEIKRLPNNRIDKLLVKISFKILNSILFKPARYILTWTSEGKSFGDVNFKEKLIKVMPPCIDMGVFQPVKRRKNGKLNILMVGRFVGYKRYNDLIKALALLDIPYVLNILGKGELEKEIKREIKNNNIKANFLENVKYKDMPEIYSKNDVLILPSYNEAIGMVVPEAMACGTPVIVSDSVGAKTYVEDGKNGLIFETFNVKDLAKKIEFFGRNKKIRERMGKEATKTIFKKYSCKVLAKEFYELTKDI